MEVVVPGVRVIRELGSGKSSVVYQGVQAAFDRPVAIKVVQGRFDRAALARFRKECLAVGPLSGHPNVITVFDAGVTAGGEPYLMMELFPRGSLAALLERSGPRPLDEILRVGIALCGALESAHRAGVFHRDVKPENILVGDDGEPVLADFGIAVVGDQSTSPEVAFTAVHAAPEVLIDDAAPTTAADVYSLGSTLYELLAGAPATPRRAGEARLAHYRRIAAEPIPLITRPDVPDDLFELIQAAMGKEADERPTLRELADRLRNVQARLQQGCSRPLVLPASHAASFAVAEPSVAAGLTTNSHDTEIFARNVTATAAEPPADPPRNSKAPLLIIGAAFVAACALVAGTAILTSNGNGASPTSTTAVTASSAIVPTSSPPNSEAVPADLIPTSVAVKASGTGRLDVTWTTPGKGPPERYTILYSNPSGKAQTKDVPSTAVSAAVDGAASGSCVRIVAIFRRPDGTGFIQGQSERACP